MNAEVQGPLAFDTLAVRALNSSRVVHLPTYAALRLLLKSARNDPAALQSFLNHRCQTRKDWRYFGFQILKDAPRGRSAEYRNCITGSPITTLAESHILSLMAAEASFQPPACAYSYRWPSSASDGRNFEYFFVGYQSRTERTQEILSSDHESVAVVTDIRRFYPTVDTKTLSHRVNARAARIPNPAAARSITQFVDGLLGQNSAKVNGIPIGPDISHVLGHVALEEVDRGMTAEFGDRYLRYVDDIIVICSRSQTGPALRKLESLLASEGLSLNSDKQDVVDPTTWRTEGTEPFAAHHNDSFSELIDDVAMFLLARPSQVNRLHNDLVEQGFALPVYRLAAQTRSRRYRSFVRRAIWGGRWVYALIRGLVHDEKSIITKALAVRAELLKSASLLATTPPVGPMRRRWFAQKRRFTYNRLLYLLPRREYRRLLSLIPEIDEFHEVRCVASAILAGDATPVLPYPGRIVSTFCQLWPEHYGSQKPKVTWPYRAGRAEAESFAQLALRLSLIAPKDVLDTVSKDAPGARILVDLCGTSEADIREVRSLTYLDEMHSLFRDIPHSTIREMLTHRYDDSEESGLEALGLGGGGYRTPWDIADYAT